MAVLQDRGFCGEERGAGGGGEEGVEKAESAEVVRGRIEVGESDGKVGVESSAKSIEGVRWLRKRTRGRTLGEDDRSQLRASRGR